MEIEHANHKDWGKGTQKIHEHLQNAIDAKPKTESNPISHWHLEHKDHHL